MNKITDLSRLNIEMEDRFYKTINDFILFTSGYYELKEKSKNFSILDEENSINFTAFQTLVVSFVANIFTDSKVKVPLLALEFLLNNRMQAELIFLIYKNRNQIPEPDVFIRCLSGIDPRFIPEQEMDESLKNYLSLLMKIFGKDYFLKSSTSILEDKISEIFPKEQSENPLLSSLISSALSFFETKNIANLSRAIADSISNGGN